MPSPGNRSTFRAPMRVRLGLAGPVLACALVALPAAAEPTAADLQNARDLFAKAERDEKAGDWSAALQKLHTAMGIKTTPGLLFHVALCEENLGSLTAALVDYQAAEQLARSTHNADVLDAVAEPLASLRTRVPSLKLEVEDAPGAEILMDGKSVPSSQLGAPFAVDPGVHRIDARAPGRVPFSGVIEAKERQAVVLAVRLAAKEAPPPRPAPPLEPPVAAQPADSSRTTELLATVGAVVLVGGGIGAYVAAGSAQSSARETCARQVTCDEKSATRVWDSIALGAWIGGAALGTVAVILWTRPTPSGAQSAWLAPAPGGLRAGASF